SVGRSVRWCCGCELEPRSVLGLETIVKKISLRHRATRSAVQYPVVSPGVRDKNAYERNVFRVHGRRHPHVFEVDVWSVDVPCLPGLILFV
ncbi:unnamed protein product, partial [Pylaiella littoralis]